MSSDFRIFKTRLNAQSEDFINLSEPPKPKDTPMLYFESNDDETVVTPHNCRSHSHLLFPRRRSTNYMDALSLKEKQKNKAKIRSRANVTKVEQPTAKRSQRRKSLLSGMDFQDTRHDIQNSNVTSDDSNNEYTLTHHDMGDYIQSSSEPPYIAQKPNRSMFRKQYRFDKDETNDDHDDNSEEENESNSMEKKPGLPTRKLSFQYEDFKKDIYNKLKFFDKK